MIKIFDERNIIKPVVPIGTWLVYLNRLALRVGECNYFFPSDPYILHTMEIATGYMPVNVKLKVDFDCPAELIQYQDLPAGTVFVHRGSATVKLENGNAVDLGSGRIFDNLSDCSLFYPVNLTITLGEKNDNNN